MWHLEIKCGGQAWQSSSVFLSLSKIISVQDWAHQVWGVPYLAPGPQLPWRSWRAVSVLECIVFLSRSQFICVHLNFLTKSSFSLLWRMLHAPAHAPSCTQSWFSLHPTACTAVQPRGRFNGAEPLPLEFPVEKQSAETGKGRHSRSPRANQMGSPTWASGPLRGWLRYLW